MENYRRTMRRDLGRLASSGRTLREIFEISFSHEGMDAYERLNDLRLETKTYRSLRKDIESFASYLRAEYLPEEGEWIAIDLPNSPSFLIAFWGSLMAGYSPYLVNSYYPLELRRRLLERLSIRTVLSFSDEYPYFRRPRILSYPKGGRPDPAWWADRFAISSSLTGMEAKIAVFDGKAVASEIENSGQIVRENPWFLHDYKGAIKVGAILPFFHVFGLVVSYLWFAFYGRTIVFFPDLSPETLRATILRHGVTHIFGPPLLFHKLWKGIEEGVRAAGNKKEASFRKAARFLGKLGNVSPYLGLALSRLLMGEVRRQAFGQSPRFMITGGAWIDPEALRTINAIGYPLFNGYGTTEASITGANLSRKFKNRTSGAIGLPFPSVRYLLDEKGVLTVEGESLAQEILYLDGRVEKASPFRTHDLVEFRDGNYFIQGREGDLFVGENGENISPDLIEQRLSLPLASRFSVLDVEGGLTLLAEYRKGLASSLIKKELLEAKSALSEIPYGSSVSSMLLTYDPIASQNAIKVSRAQLRKALEDGSVRTFPLSSLGDDRPVSMGGSEDPDFLRLKELVLDSLGRKTEVLPGSDYFLDLGGDSMGYISLLLMVEQTFSLRLDLEKERALRTPEDFLKKIKEKQ